VRDVVTAGKYDLVHLHTPVCGFVARYALRKHSLLRVIYTAHGLHFHRDRSELGNAMFLLLEKLAGQWTDYLVVINDEDKAAAGRHRIVPPGRVVYMPGIGIDLEAYDPQQLRHEAIIRLRDEMQLAPDQVLFLMIGEFIARKRHSDVVRALARVNNKRIAIAFAGDGPLLAATERLGRSLGMESRLRFLGFRPDIRTLIGAASATLLTSDQEGLPRAVMESMALGVPVIGTDVRGTRDLLSSGAGLIVPIGDIGALAHAMDLLAGDSEQAHRMGAAGRVQVRAYDLDKVIRLHEQLYTEALGDVPPSAPGVL
jgi:glycosyltransferase involved in cell wall biosynthesis